MKSLDIEKTGRKLLQKSDIIKFLSKAGAMGIEIKRFVKSVADRIIGLSVLLHMSSDKKTVLKNAWFLVWVAWGND